MTAPTKAMRRVISALEASPTANVRDGDTSPVLYDGNRFVMRVARNTFDAMIASGMLVRVGYAFAAKYVLPASGPSAPTAETDEEYSRRVANEESGVAPLILTPIDGGR